MRNRSRFFPTALAVAVIALMVFGLLGTAGAAGKNDKEPPGQSSAPGNSGDKGGGPPAGAGNQGGNSGGGGSDSTPPSQGDTSDSGSGSSGSGQGTGGGTQGGGSGGGPATSGSGKGSGKGGSATGGGAGPNRGFIQVEQENIDDTPQNAPHEGCLFTIEFRNFKGTGLVTASLDLVNPTPGGATSDSTTLDDDPAGGGHDLDATILLDLLDIAGIEDVEPHMINGEPALHVRLDVTTPWGEKHHTFWAINCPPQAPTGGVTIVKNAIPDSDQGFDFGGNLGDFTLVDDHGQTGNETITFNDLDAGTYTAEELGPPEGWTLDDVSCVVDGTESEASISGATASIDLAAGEHVTCTFTNKRQGPPPEPASITIIKNAVPDDDQAFTYSGTLGGFTLVDDGSGTANTITFDELEAGSYSVTEDQPPTGWSLDSLTCDDPDGGTAISGATASIDLDLGEHVVCTYVNTLTLGQPPTEPPPPGVPPTGPPPVAPGGPPLAFTGLDATVLILTAAALAAVGIALLLAANRREEAARRG